MVPRVPDRYSKLYECLLTVAMGGIYETNKIRIINHTFVIFSSVKSTFSAQSNLAGISYLFLLVQK